MLPSTSFFDAIFFDMDGLMVDSEPQWFLSEIEVTKPFGYTWLESDQIACLGGPLIRVGQYMYEKCGSQESPEYFTQTLIELQSQRMRTFTPAMPGAVELVKSLQSAGVKTGLVSASPRIIVDAVLDSLGHDLFPFSISSDDVLRTKPEPECYLKAAEISGSNITNCLVFEDSLTGVHAATSSGAFLIAVPHLVDVDESERVRVVESLEQLDIHTLQRLHQDFSAII